MQNRQLSKKEIQNIQVLARKKLVEYYKLNDVIGMGIFSILERDNKVLYYPLEDQRVWGFSEKIKGKSFVCINTSLPYDKQVFTAAHELYHVWFGSSGEIMISEDAQEPDLSDEIELFANRFAAEFLVNEELLRQEIQVFNMDKDNLNIKDIVRLSSLFVVPYRTMVRRLHEIGVLAKKDFEKYISYTDEEADTWKNRLGVSIPERKNKIGLSDLADKALDLYERNMITYEKLEYLLEFAELTPEEMGIKSVNQYQPPTDEELDVIMEE